MGQPFGAAEVVNRALLPPCPCLEEEISFHQQHNPLFQHDTHSDGFLPLFGQVGKICLPEALPLGPDALAL